MTADLTPRETVARAMGESGAFGCGCCAWADDRDLDADDPRAATLARAALTALADHPGLVEVLGKHVLSGGWREGRYWKYACSWCPWRSDQDEWAAHLADVIRAWLRGAS